jgi:CHAT domain-containing protein
MATGLLMEDFYRNLLVGHKRANEALQSGQLKMLADPRTSSPAASGSVCTRRLARCL